MIYTFFQAFLVGASVLIGLTMIRFGLALARGSRTEYERNRVCVRSTRAIVRGEVSTKFDGARDDRVAAGIAIDLKSNKWKEQGRLSSEAQKGQMSFG